MKISLSTNDLLQPLLPILNKFKIQNSLNVSKIVNAVALAVIAGLLLLIINKTMNYNLNFARKINNDLEKANNELPTTSNNPKETHNLLARTNDLTRTTNELKETLARDREIINRLAEEANSLERSIEDLQQQIHHVQTNNPQIILRTILVNSRAFIRSVSKKTHKTSNSRPSRSF
jgi:uncharacterized protein YoxC